MSNTLEDFARSYNDVQRGRREFTPVKEQWYSWNYWAQHGQKLFSFGRWMIENNLDYEDVAGSKTHYPQANVLYDREEGYRYYNAWRGGQKAIDDAEKTFDQIFQQLWEELTLSGQPVYDNETLGEAIGKSAEELRKFASKRSWYFPRGKKGTK